MWYGEFVGILRPQDFSGPIRQPGDCGCGSTSLPTVTQPPTLIPTVSPCDPEAPGNQPVTPEQYRCSIGVTLQPVIDGARRIAHEKGFRPYRVFLVWQIRQRDRTFVEHCRVELMPVRVMTLESLDLTAEVWGQELGGQISLREISPQQVTEDVLRGFIDGVNWAEKSTEREFFYEIEMHARCAGHVPRKRRFIPSGPPFFRAGEYAFRMSLTEQKVSRSRTGVDQTVGTEHGDQTPVQTLPRLVT